MSDSPSYDELVDRVQALQESNAELERYCRERQQSIALLDAIRKAQSLYITDSEPSEIYEFLLQTLMEVTESEYGFLDEVVHDDTGRVLKKNLAISNITWDEHSQALYRQLQDRDMKFEYLDNLSGLPALTGNVVLSNDPAGDSRSKGTPRGHPAIRNFLGMPLYFGGELVCVAGVANKPGGYSEEMPRFVEPLLSTCAGITFALKKEAERKQTETALKKSREDFKTIADFTYDWEYWQAPDGQYVYVSPSCRRITGYDPEDFQRNCELMESIIHPEDRARVADHEQQENNTTAIDYRIVTRDGTERWIGHICRPVYSEGGHYLGRRGSNRDITEQKRLQDQSHKAHTMQAISTLAGGVAHQFNNALSVIVGNLELLEEDCSGDARVVQYALEMQASADRMKGLTRQLLAYARGGKYQAATVSLQSFLRETLPILQHSFDAEISLDNDWTAQELYAKIDKTQLQMTLAAIVANASEAMEGKGRIGLRLDTVCVEHTADREQPELEAGDYACLTITDEGRGMDPAVQDRIFEPFFSTKFQGRGLGMAAAYGIIKNHQGAISVASRQGAGTTVSIYLPLVETAPEKQQSLRP